jgi:hypothetical protein
LCHADIGISQQRLYGLDVVVGEFWRTASAAAEATGGGKAHDALCDAYAKAGGEPRAIGFL